MGLALHAYDAGGRGLGTNTGDVPALIPKAAQLVAEIAAETRQPARLIGWSLGGYLAREAARERPTAVSRVITLGRPVIGGPKCTAVADVYRRQATISTRSRRASRIASAFHSRSRSRRSTRRRMALWRGGPVWTRRSGTLNTWRCAPRTSVPASRRTSIESSPSAWPQRHSHLRRPPFLWPSLSSA